MPEVKKILDVCCGGRMFWFNKSHPDVLYVDKRVMGRKKIWQGKGKRQNQSCYFDVSPDKVEDFRKLSFSDETFNLVVFDPPHIIENKISGYQSIKYGVLSPESWREDIRLGFLECFRVLKDNGILIFKWNEVDFPVSEILKLCPYRPLFGHKSGRQQKTHWLCFMKSGTDWKPKGG